MAFDTQQVFLLVVFGEIALQCRAVALHHYIAAQTGDALHFGEGLVRVDLGRTGPQIVVNATGVVRWLYGTECPACIDLLRPGRVGKEKNSQDGCRDSVHATLTGI